MEDAQLAAELVRDAAALAARIRAEGLDVERKTSGSDIVTQADTAAEDLIVSRLAAARPDDGILAEEGSARESRSGRTWVIDPVDGTYNFTRGSDWWCSAMALVTTGAAGSTGSTGAAGSTGSTGSTGEPDGDVVLGAVHHAASARTWLGGPDLPSTVNGDPLAALPDTPREARCATTYLHPPFYRGEIGEVFARALEEVGTLRMLGSGTMDAMAIAIGQWDVLFQHSVTPWDRFPGAAIIRGAGGDSVVVPAAGVEWTISGAPGAVADVRRALLGG